MFRVLAAMLLVGQGLVHVAAFLLSWVTVQQVFAPGPPWITLPERIITLAWLVLILGVMALAVAGLMLAAWGLASRQGWWRVIAIISALTSMVGILPWLAFLPGTFTFAIAALDALVVGALAFPWGDQIVHVLQGR